MLIVAGACGFIASQLMGAKRVNIILLIVLGFVGAAVGNWAANFFGFPPILTISAGGHAFPLVWTILGSMLVVAIVTMIGQH